MEMEEPSGGESRWSRLAPSLPVRNVQALAACAEELTAATLERYIRLDIHNDEVLDEQSGEVPVIDLARLLHPDSVEEEAARLRLACEDWGFFQLVNHGIQEDIITNIRSDIQKFFHLPLEMKNAYSQRPGDIQGYGQSFVVSESQTLDWADMFAILAQPPQARDMRYWPTQPHTFRKYIEDYSSELMKVAHFVVTFIAKTLNVDLELMRDKYVSQVFRMNYYPPCMSMPEKVLGFSPHSDASFLTLLLEVNSVAGLQIKRHNKWIPVKPNPKALLVNVGDFLEIMSNGKYKSIEHRVTINPNQERLTISAFHIPSLDGIISPVTGSTEEMILYKTVAVEEYAKLYMSNKLDGKRAFGSCEVVLI
ncbi:2-oxoglutarate-dependent dioxygenase 11-like [Phragmites australis]|uniref:2-oxoglutarate-dependent dioxygenase 11-like n=1 Tax=Phragmites australis TaxID=29695 RepID=UPI002D79C54E|nr:2-oxoglutarate-dependent dioxygenase 11-like [Phragmites australis]